MDFSNADRQQEAPTAWDLQPESLSLKQSGDSTHTPVVSAIAPSYSVFD